MRQLKPGHLRSLRRVGRGDWEGGGSGQRERGVGGADGRVGSGKGGEEWGGGKGEVGGSGWEGGGGKGMGSSELVDELEKGKKKGEREKS